MSEELVPGLPPLPPVRPMSEDDWTRLEARIDAAIEGHERGRRRRLVLALAAALLVLLVAAGATWWHSTRPTAGTTAYYEVLCASEPSLSARVTASRPSDGTDPRSQCEERWRQGEFGRPGPPPAPLVACAREGDGAPVAWVFPDAAPATCARLGLGELPEGYAADNARFGALRQAIGSPSPEDGSCDPYGEVHDRAVAALAEHGFDGWEVARDPATVAGDRTCVWFWAADLEQEIVFVYGWTGGDPEGS